MLTVAGPVLDEADECIARGLLRGTGDGLAFSHELAREAILAAIAPLRRRLLHARVLAALREEPEAERDLARLAHHAEAAGDRAAVLEFAIAAAEQAAALHAHREAAAQYARALRFADRLPAAERARLLEGRSARLLLERSRRGGHRGAPGGARHLAHVSVTRSRKGRTSAGCRASTGSRAAVPKRRRRRLPRWRCWRPLPPGPELAMAYSNLAQLRMLDHDLEGTLQWGNRAIALAEQLGETETLVHALANVGAARRFAGDDQGHEELERSLQLALDRGLLDHAGRALTFWPGRRCWPCGSTRPIAGWPPPSPTRSSTISTSTAGISWRRERHSAPARAAGTRPRRRSVSLLRQPMLSPVTRFVALTTLGQVGARRGNPEAAAALDEALALADRTGQLLRLGPVRAARAEAALLARRSAASASGSGGRARSGLQRGAIVGSGANSPGCCGKPASGTSRPTIWPSRTPSRSPATAPGPPLPGRSSAAPMRRLAPWPRATIPTSSAARSRPSSGSGRSRPSRTRSVVCARLASTTCHRCGADHGPTTRAHPAGLTQREAEVLALVAAGLRNAEIAERLYLTPKTVSHHLSAIYAKLGVETRIEAAHAASQLGIATP